MIRTREWKYIHRYPHGPHELYALHNDPDERINLIGDDRIYHITGSNKASVVQQMKAQLDDWFRRYTNPHKDGTKEVVTGRGATYDTWA